jgi:hypothetical protein
MATGTDSIKINDISSVTTSYAHSAVYKLISNHNQSNEERLDINASVTNTGHGAIFISSSNDGKLQLLVGAHFARHGELKIGIFGGKCDRGERTIDTMIREVIEEIFCFKASPSMIYHISTFLNKNPHLYYIHQMGNTHYAYSYFFDVSILGVFIQIILSLENEANLIPTSYGLANIDKFLQKNITMRDYSSFDGPHYPGFETTIKLVEFIKTRYISERLQRTYKQMGIHPQAGLNEVKYLSCVSLTEILDALPHKRFHLVNFVKNIFENLKMQTFLVKILSNEIFEELKTY